MMTAPAPVREPLPAGDAAKLLTTDGLGKQYGRFVAVKNVSISIGSREIKALIGPNGAGKTTLFNMLSGQMRPTEGRILYKGDDVTNLRANEFARRGIGRSFQITSVFPRLSVIENIRIAAQVKRHRDLDFFSRAARLKETHEIADTLLSFVGLTRYGRDEAGYLSHGDQRRLEIAIVLATDPELVLLDEPTAGMSRDDAEEFSDLLLEIAKEKTVLFVEHNIDFVMKVAHSVAVMERGSLLVEGTPAEIRRSAEVRRAYLGSLHD